MEFLQPKENRRKDPLQWIFSLAIGILAALLIALILTQAVFMPVEVVGDSMKATLNNGDVLIVSKMRNPKRGDVVVVDRGEGALIIKRVVGISGDTLWSEDGVLYIQERGGTAHRVQEEYLTPYHQTATYRMGNATNREDLPAITVPDGCYFVLGDNRTNSQDSRYYGAFSKKEIVGVVPRLWIKNKHLLDFLQ